MTGEILAALGGFAFVSSITPGPNNLMLMASGANFGFRRTLPHLFGVGIGFVVMVVLVGLGLLGTFAAWPASYDVLRAASFAYLSYLAWRIATAAPLQPAGHGGRPLGFLQAALFQWVNPKAWTMALTAVTLYAPDRSVTAVLLVAAVFGLVNLPSVGSWTLLGTRLAQLLSSPQRQRRFNGAMALLLLLSVLPLLASRPLGA